MPKILVVDDHPMMLRTIRSVLQSNSLEVCGEAETGEEAIEKVVALKPDLVILDARFKTGMDGFTAAREIRRVAPSVKILMFTFYDEPGIAEGVRELGIDACVLKSEGGTKLLEEVRRLL